MNGSLHDVRVVLFLGTLILNFQKKGVTTIEEKQFKDEDDFEIVGKKTTKDVTKDKNKLKVGFECGSSGDDYHHQLLLCDKCDKGYHMNCIKPVVVRIPTGKWYCPGCSVCPQVQCFSQEKIYDFFRIKNRGNSFSERISLQDSRKRKRRASSLVHHKKKRKLLPYVPSEDPDSRLNQMRSLAFALTSLKLKFSDDLTYSPGMAPKSANKASLEIGGMQVLSEGDKETLNTCREMGKRGECAPLLVVYDSRLGFNVQADAPIKDMTFIAEYTGDVDYIKNRDQDDCNSLMTLLLTSDPDKSLVICPDKRGNIARFFNGINNHIRESKKKQNIKCVRYNVDGQCRVLLVATRDIAKGDKLYIDYNGHENEYPTHDFI
ncbi:probable Histone-lysine N-methyltransferase ATXR5 [Rutidosis leptorrhynchoides]|uniref:probable Histone-lysine N-methyltransferase ATXR5 n=1 Tax=Rutidosis leptorrhynchoides TaxID=125765 RepID=UPI003A98D29A